MTTPSPRLLTAQSKKRRTRRSKMTRWCFPPTMAFHRQHSLHCTSQSASQWASRSARSQRGPGNHPLVIAMSSTVIVVVCRPFIIPAAWLQPTYLLISWASTLYILPTPTHSLPALPSPPLLAHLPAITILSEMATAKSYLHTVQWLKAIIVLPIRATATFITVKHLLLKIAAVSVITTVPTVIATAVSIPANLPTRDVALSITPVIVTLRRTTTTTTAIVSAQTGNYLTSNRIFCAAVIRRESYTTAWETRTPPLMN